MRIGDVTLRDGQIITEPGARAGRNPHEATAGQALSPDAGPSPFAKLLHGLGREVDRGEALVRRALGGSRGQEVDNFDLLTLQAGVYRYSEAVDLSAKLVDRATSGVKTVLQGQ